MASMKRDSCTAFSYIESAINGAGNVVFKSFTSTATARSAGGYTSTPTTKVDASIMAGWSAREERGLALANGAWFLKSNLALFAGKCVDFSPWDIVSSGVQIGGRMIMFSCNYNPPQLFTWSSSDQIQGVCVALLLHR